MLLNKMTMLGIVFPTGTERGRHRTIALFIRNTRQQSNMQKRSGLIQYLFVTAIACDHSL